MLETLDKTTWDEIEVGEVFAINSCWAVLCKTEKEDAILLSADCRGWQMEQDGELGWKPWVTTLCKYSTYKLPLSVQRLWKEE